MYQGGWQQLLSNCQGAGPAQGGPSPWPPARRERRPAHGDLALAPAAGAVGQGPGRRQGAYGAYPALPGAECAVGRRRRPGAVEVAEEGVHRLARHVAVDERLGETFGQVGGGGQGGEAGGEGDRSGALGAERDPYVAAADLVAGALDQQPIRCEPRAQARPGGGDLGLRRTGAARSPRGSGHAGRRPRAAGSRSRPARRPAPRARRPVPPRPAPGRSRRRTTRTSGRTVAAAPAARPPSTGPPRSPGRRRTAGSGSGAAPARARRRASGPSAAAGSGSSSRA